MSYQSKLLVILTSLLIIAGCGLHNYPISSNVADFPYRYADFDYKYAWKTTDTDKGILISGIIKNVRYAYIKSVEIRIALLNKDGNTVVESLSFPMPQQSIEGEICDFSMLLETRKPVSGDVLLFQIHYTGNEGGRNSNINWHSSFKADAVTGIVSRMPNIDGGKW